ncbi:ABC transporter permease [Clostridium sp. AL.422]|uniref:ABC transporter permease n=1 Tax=Clostridium TaxID=1485 RepID=UPI00293DDB11|nr:MULTISPECIES: ABC transporter permease [unclassified Clostridium]MDV4149440.1 ABC transporter permease [Clostridium sp. AL.422]
MKRSLIKISSLTEFKIKEIMKNKTFLFSLVTAPLIILIYRFAFAEMMGGKLDSNMIGVLVKLGSSVSMATVALTFPATLLAKDKEKNTLRTLMTSSVTGIEYLISVLVPVVILSIIVNVAILFISGIELQNINIPYFLLAISFGCLASAILGTIVGIFSKNQMAATSNLTSFILLLTMIPVFSDSVSSLKKINDFLFTGIITNMFSGFVEGNKNPLTILNWSVLVGSCVVLIIAFAVCYKRNGFEND